MSQNDLIQLISMASLIVIEAYAIQPWKFPVFAIFWDWIARITGHLANWLGWQSMHARSNYYMVVSQNGN